jgi:hypothetical protein
VGDGLSGQRPGLFREGGIVAMAPIGNQPDNYCNCRMFKSIQRRFVETLKTLGTQITLGGRSEA